MNCTQKLSSKHLRAFFIVLLVLLSGAISFSFAQKFDFNDGTTQGWTLDQMYVTSTQTKFTPVSGYTLMNSNNELVAYASSLLIGRSDQNDIYLESPDLSSNSNWQGITGYCLDVTRSLYSPCWGDIADIFFIQLQIKVVDTNDGNKEKLFAEYDGTNFVFHEIRNTGQLYQFTWKPSWLTDPRYIVKKIRLRITGPGDVMSECWYRGGWRIDNVTGVDGQTTSSITINEPNGGEKWQVGSSQDIWWTNTNFSDPVKIEYSTDGGSTYSTIVSSTTNSGSYTWTVPDEPSNNCLIRVSDAADGSPMDVSDATFSIVSSSLTLTSPNGGENWQVGSQQTISWTSTNIPDNDVKIEYSTDNGQTWTFINYHTNNQTSESYTWTVPADPSTQCLIRISLYMQGVFISDMSDTVFAISSSSTAKFDFNDGTLQGWTMQGAFDENGNGPYQNNFWFTWTDVANYPTPAQGTNQGCAAFITGGGHGITDMSGTYWIMRFTSPDLSSNSSWQSATGYSVKIVENMTVGSELYANLYVTVYDYDQQKDRYFYNGQAQKLTFSSYFGSGSAIWNMLNFDWSSIGTFPTNFEIKSIHINIWGKLQALYEGQVGIDEVIAITGGENTNMGSNVQVSLGNGVNVTFSNVTGAGNTSLTTSTNGTAPPDGYTIVPSGSPTYYSITTTATYSGNITICIQYDDTGLTSQQEVALKLNVYENSQWVDITTSLDTDANVICGEVNHLSEFAVMYSSGSSATHFTYTDNTGDSYSVVIDEATLDGNPLSVGDEIGVFTPSGLCVGASVWDGTTPIALTAWCDDNQTQDVDGYTAGETMAFKIWSVSDNAEYPATATYSQGNGNFGDGAYAQVSQLAAVSSITQTMALAQGWSWVSFHVQPADLTVSNVFSSVNSLAIIVNNGGQFYIPGVINNIGQLNILEGYKLYLTSAEQVSLTGQPVPADTPIPLSSGWNFVSYLPTTSIGAETALKSILSNLAIIKDDAGNFFIPEVINNLNNMSAGEGYKLYLNANDTLIYPLSSQTAKIYSRTPITVNRLTRHFTHCTGTGESYSVVIHDVQLTDTQLRVGDEIGLFTKSGLCVGAGVWNGGVVGIAAWADDERTDKVEGYQDGDAMIFKYWDTDKEKEIPLHSIFRKGNGEFGTGAFASVELTGEIVPGHFLLHQNYPNPFNPETHITFQLPKKESVELTIFNVEGKAIRTLINKEMNGGTHQISWDGFDRYGNQVPSGVYIYRLKTESFVAMKKATLIK